MQNIISVFKEIQKLLTLIADTNIKLTAINKRLIYYWQYTSDILRYYANLSEQTDYFILISILKDDNEIEDD